VAERPNRGISPMLQHRKLFERTVAVTRYVCGPSQDRGIGRTDSFGEYVSTY
jgi:hypothetical protein